MSKSDPCFLCETDICRSQSTLLSPNIWDFRNSLNSDFHFTQALQHGFISAFLPRDFLSPSKFDRWDVQTFQTFSRWHRWGFVNRRENGQGDFPHWIHLPLRIIRFYGYCAINQVIKVPESGKFGPAQHGFNIIENVTRIRESDGRSDMISLR
jgi:hypothetical protein